MAQITERMREVISKTHLFSVATASAKGEPNVVAIAFVRQLSDHELLVMDNFMGKTKANLKENPQIAISCWVTDPQTDATRAYQFKGVARFETSGKVFTEGCQWVKSIKPMAQSKSAVIVKVHSIYNLDPFAK